MTQMKQARAGQITPAMAAVAAEQGLAPENIRERVAAGTVTIDWRGVTARTATPAARRLARCSATIAR